MDIQNLKHHVQRFYHIGPRNIGHYENLVEAQDYIACQLKNFSAVKLQQFTAKGKTFCNIIGELRGAERPEEVIVVGAHFDTYKNSPGCNDNGSALAVLFELARYFKSIQFQRTLRLVCFTNSEKPFTRTPKMGSLVYARHCKRNNEKIVSMVCLEALGCRKEEEGSQRFSFGGFLFPTKGNFLEVVANMPSEPVLRDYLPKLREKVPIDTKVLPGFLPGVKSSDHWSFWKVGYPAIMLTDTAPLRSPFYHTRKDTPEKIDYDWLSRVGSAIRDSLIDQLGVVESNHLFV